MRLCQASVTVNKNQSRDPRNRNTIATIPCDHVAALQVGTTTLITQWDCVHTNISKVKIITRIINSNHPPATMDLAPCSCRNRAEQRVPEDQRYSQN